MGMFAFRQQREALARLAAEEQEKLRGQSPLQALEKCVPQPKPEKKAEKKKPAPAVVITEPEPEPAPEPVAEVTPEPEPVVEPQAELPLEEPVEEKKPVVRKRKPKSAL